MACLGNKCLNTWTTHCTNEGAEGDEAERDDEEEGGTEQHR